MACIDDAVGLAVSGLPVFPCQWEGAKRKSPVTKHGLLEATRDLIRVRSWWRRWPLALIGMPTGAPSGLTVLDIDPKALVWMRQRQACGALRQTRIHQTPRGGYHFLYRNPSPLIRNSASKLAPGADIRGDGGYVIYPPSAGYVVVDEHEPVDFPLWIIAALARVEQQKALKARSAVNRFGPLQPGNLEPLAKFLAAAPLGERNNRMFWAACRAGEAVASGSIAEADAVATLRAAAGSWNDQERAAKTLAGGLRHAKQDGPRERRR